MMQEEQECVVYVNAEMYNRLLFAELRTYYDRVIHAQRHQEGDQENNQSRIRYALDPLQSHVPIDPRRILIPPPPLEELAAEQRQRRLRGEMAAANNQIYASRPLQCVSSESSREQDIDLEVPLHMMPSYQIRLMRQNVRVGELTSFTQMMDRRELMQRQAFNMLLQQTHLQHVRLLFEEDRPLNSEGNRREEIFVPMIELKRLPPPIHIADSRNPRGYRTAIICRVCRTTIDLQPSDRSCVVQCLVCNEGTPFQELEDGRVFYSCLCHGLIVCKPSMKIVMCPRLSCRRLLRLVHPSLMDNQTRILMLICALLYMLSNVTKDDIMVD